MKLGEGGLESPFLLRCSSLHFQLNLSWSLWDGRHKACAGVRARGQIKGSLTQRQKRSGLLGSTPLESRDPRGCLGAATAVSPATAGSGVLGMATS